MSALRSKRWIIVVGVMLGALTLRQVRAQTQVGDPIPVPDMSLDEAISAIQMDDADMRFQGAIKLCSLGPKAAPAVDAVIDQLKNHDPAKYMELLHVLIALGPEAKPAVPVLIKCLTSENFHVRYLSCRALGACGKTAKPAVKPLIKLTSEPVTSVRRRAVEALGNLGPDIAPEALKPLIKAAGDFMYPVRVEAMLALGKFGARAKEALPVVERVMKNPKASERSQAAWAFYRITGEEDRALMALAEDLNNIDHPWDAAAMLVQMAPKVPKAVEVLSTGLQNPAPDVREVAAEALGKTGRLAKPMLMNLKEAAGDQNDDARAAIREAIKRIEESIAKSAKPSGK